MKWSKLDKVEKFHFLLNIFIFSTLLIAIFFAIYEKNWMALFVSVLTLLLTQIPKLFEKKYKIYLPAEFQIIIVLFIYAGIFLGEVKDYYTRFWWWDSVLHAFSGVGLGFLGFLILYVLYKSGKLKADPKLIALFSFCFALALGAVWEIFEFGMDSFFGLNMQRARDLEQIHGYCDTRLGVLDTMWDLILDAVGALIASIAGYIYIVKGEVPILDNLVKKFEKKNPGLFKT